LRVSYLRSSFERRLRPQMETNAAPAPALIVSSSTPTPRPTLLDSSAFVIIDVKPKEPLTLRIPHDSPIEVSALSPAPPLPSPPLPLPLPASPQTINRSWEFDEEPFNSLCKNHLNWPRYFWVVLFQKIVEASCLAEAKEHSITVPRESSTTTRFESALRGAFEMRKLRRLEIQTRKRLLSSVINEEDWTRCITTEGSGRGGRRRGGGGGEEEEDTAPMAIPIYPFNILFTPSPSYQLLNIILDRRAAYLTTSISPSSSSSSLHLKRSLSPSGSRFFFATKRSPQVSPIPRIKSSQRLIPTATDDVVRLEAPPEIIRRRVTRSELGCILHTLIEHHPDLKSLRSSPLLMNRYCEAVSASLFASAGGACGQALLLSVVLREGGIGDTLWQAARIHLHKLPAFSRSEFKLLNASFELAAKASKVEDSVDAQLSSALSIGVWSRIKVSFSRAVTRFSRLDKVEEMPTSPRSPPFSGYKGLPVSAVVDPDPSSDDDAYVTLSHFLRFFRPDITRLALERAFAGRGRALDSGVTGRMAFADICALLAANIWGMKGDAATIEYWLRCCDIDDDGMLSFEDAVSCIEAKALHSRLEKRTDHVDTSASIAALKELWPTSKFSRLTGRIPLSARDIEREKIGGPLFRLLVSFSETGLCEGKKE